MTFSHMDSSPSVRYSAQELIGVDILRRGGTCNLSNTMITDGAVLSIYFARIYVSQEYTDSPCAAASSDLSDNSGLQFTLRFRGSQ